jgi:hypothetical protein
VGEDYPQTTRSVAPTPRMGLSESTAKNGEKPRKQEARNGQMNRQDARIAKARSVLSTADTHCQAGAAGANCHPESDRRVSEFYPQITPITQIPGCGLWTMDYGLWTTDLRLGVWDLVF